MRRLRPWILGLALVAALGCGSVLDELDAANAMAGKGKVEEKTAKTGEADAQKPGYEWTATRSINSGQVSENIVSCKLRGGMQFMEKQDCINRGGTPGRV